MSEAHKQITPRLRRWGDVYEVDGEPLRRTVGCAPRSSLLEQLDQLNENLRGLSDVPQPPPDARRVRKAVGKIG